MKSLTILIASLFVGLLSFNTYAASVDGSIDRGEYQWNTNGAEGSDKWETFSRGGRAYHEYNDASGGDSWDINFLGTNVADGKYQFGAIGGQILSGLKTGSSWTSGQAIYLSDFAISVNNFTNPTVDSSGFDYAIRLLGVNDKTGEAEFALLTGGTWESADIYGSRYGDKHKTETYKMGDDATTITTFTGKWSNNGGDDNVLEGEFDLSFLSLFDPSTGGTLSTYLTMACVNDEALVHADIAAVPVPAAIWLFAPALAGFMGLRRRKTA
ncbi:MAG: hypothetical protein COB23_02830 [Methylophaga sp.]|nr:MAG: hypothetical protein COB23_02830 [Methylophaga sp.]